MSEAMQETTAFLDRLAELEPVAAGDVAAVRARRRLLASMFNSGPSEVGRSDEIVAGVQVARFLPGSSDPGKIILYVHGGGWVAGDLNTHDGICRRLASEGELEVIAVDYRRPPEHRHPAAVDDVLSVLDAVGDDASELVLAGDSSGGHVAFEAALRYAGSDLAGLLLIQPACDPSISSPSWSTYGAGYFLTLSAMRWYWDTYLGDERISPLWDRELDKFPPTYVFTTSLDPSADEARRLANALTKSGVDVTACHVDDLPHGCLTVPAAFPSAHPEIRAAALWMHDLSKGTSQ